MSIFKKAVSASGPVMRVLIGAGAFVLLILGLKEKSGKDAGLQLFGKQRLKRKE